MARPVPIPNTAVKHSLANGSGLIDSARVGCRQSFSKAGPGLPGPAFFVPFEQVPARNTRTVSVKIGKS